MHIRVLIAALDTSSLLALAACGNSAPAGSGQGGSGQGRSGHEGSSPGKTPVSTQPVQAAKKVNVCAALPASAASQITGTTFTTTKPSSVAGVVFGCEYGGPDSALLQISVDTEGGTTRFDADISALKAVGHPPNRISGVGDAAFSEPDPRNAGAEGAVGFASYGAVFGDTYIKVGGLTYVTADEGKQIVETLHSKV
jgi:hypothetical protein